MSNLGAYLIETTFGNQVDGEGSAAMAEHALSQVPRKLVDQAALYPVFADDEFTTALKTLAGSIGKAKCHRFQLRTGESLTQMIAPGYVESAIRALQWRNRNALVLQPAYPRSVRSQFRPAGTAHRQHSCAGPGLEPAGFSLKEQTVIGVPAHPAMTQSNLHALPTQPLHPRAKQGGSLHPLRKNLA